MDEWQTIQYLVEKVQHLTTQLQGNGSAAEWELEAMRDRLADQLRPRIHRMARCIVYDRDSLDDIVQESLIQVIDNLRNYDQNRAPFRCWLVQLVTRTAYHYLNRNGRIRSAEVIESALTLLDDDEETPFFDETPAPDALPTEEIIAKDRLERILECAEAALSPDEYLVWSEYFIHGSAYSEIAVLLRRREDWVRQNLHRAREKAAAAIVLNPHILSNEEINSAIERCQQSENRLSDAELEALRQSLRTNPRQPPGWRSVNLFRQACIKILPYAR